MFFFPLCFIPSYRSWLKHITVTRGSMVWPCNLEVRKSSYNQLTWSIFLVAFLAKFMTLFSLQQYLSLSFFSSFHLHIAKSDKVKEFSNLSIIAITSWPCVLLLWWQAKSSTVIHNSENFVWYEVHNLRNMNYKPDPWNTIFCCPYYSLLPFNNQGFCSVLV